MARSHNGIVLGVEPPFDNGGLNEARGQGLSNYGGEYKSRGGIETRVGDEVPKAHTSNGLPRLLQSGIFSMRVHGCALRDSTYFDRRIEA